MTEVQEREVQTDTSFENGQEIDGSSRPGADDLETDCDDAADPDYDSAHFLDEPSSPKKQVKQCKRHPCSECGESFVKPSNLKQHMLCHATEKVFCCPIAGCASKYKRPDHLKRHMVLHSGQLFFCTWEGCSASFTLVSNLKRHTKLHQMKGDYLQRSGKRVTVEEKSFVCEEPTCVQAFEFSSHLRQHKLKVHGKKHKLHPCSSPGCEESFTDYEALQKHMSTSHRYFACEVCGMSVPKKLQIKHHNSHADSQQRVPCPSPGCQHSYTKRSNLNIHIKAVHKEIKPFVCKFPDCGRRFAYKAVRDRHEQTSEHCPTQGDFENEDEDFQSRERGGRPRVILDSVDQLFEDHEESDE